MADGPAHKYIDHGKVKLVVHEAFQTGLMPGYEVVVAGDFVGRPRRYQLFVVEDPAADATDVATGLPSAFVDPDTK